MKVIIITIGGKLWTTALCLIAAGLFVLGLGLGFWFVKQTGTCGVIVALATLVLLVLALTAIQMCYVLAAKSIAQSAIQLKIEEEKRKEAEIKRDIEDKKYECAGKVHKVQIV